MTDTSISMARSPSTDSSAFSNIDVAASREDISAHAASTPPTSVSDVRSVLDSTKDAEVEASPQSARPRRSRAAPTTYNLTQLANAQAVQVDRSRKRPRENEAANGEDDDSTPVKAQKTQSKGQSARGAAASSAKAGSKFSLAQKVRDASAFFGKTGRKVVEAGKRQMGISEAKPKEKTSKLLRELETGTRGVLDEIDLDVSFPAPKAVKSKKPAKEAEPDPKLLAQLVNMPSGPLQKTSDGKRVKKWQDAGLYVGQSFDKDSTRLHKKESSSTEAPKAPFMPLPMFSYLESSRHFTIPFDIFAPTLKKGDEKPKDWHKINRNRLVGEAKELWEKDDSLPLSVCVCTLPAAGEQGCGDDCLNRVMQYECNADNCGLGPGMCSNRAFVELAARIKKGGAYDIGVEVVKTTDRGFGIRAARSFAPGQIIMEYTGEIISESECQRRMREDYKDKQCYYLMELERNLVIDGTKGSMARFINHSCDPNCEVRMVKVNGTPRMAVYAGDAGIVTGQELTYDYNFDNFGEIRQMCYCGAQNCRGYLSKRLNATEQKKQAKVEEERRRLAALEAQKAAIAEAKKKQVKNSRGSNWRGWVAVDDAEVKEQLRAEKRAREEADKTSSRALRMAARHGDVAAAQKLSKGISKSQVEPDRRKTVGYAQEHAKPARAQEKAISKPSTTSTKKRRHTMEELVAEIDESASSPSAKKQKQNEPASPSTKKQKQSEPVASAKKVKIEPLPEKVQSTTTIIHKTTVTLNVEEVEIHSEEVTKKGKLPTRRTSSIKLKQSTLNFARIS